MLLLKLSRGLLRDLNGLTLHATIPSLGSAATGIPVFYLPESLLDGTGLDVGDEASLVVVMWLESPFRAIAGGNELVPGSYVSSVWVEDLNIYGLDDPVQVRLPFLGINSKFDCLSYDMSGKFYKKKRQKS